MAQQPHDDLFEGPSMTFGEHLEELRTCLFKSIMGLIIGVAIGMFFANAVVRFFQSPLERALEAYYQKLAIKDLETNEYKSGVPAEISRMILHYGIVPDRVSVDLGQFSRSLKRQYPNMQPLGEVAFSSYGYSLRDFRAEGMEDLARKFVKGGQAASASAEKRAWELLKKDQQDRLTALVEKKAWGTEERGEFLVVMNSLIERPELAEAKEFQFEVPAVNEKPVAGSALPGSATAAEPSVPTEAIPSNEMPGVQEHSETTPQDNIRRLNMRAIYHAFPSLLNPPVLNTTELWIWKKVKVRFQTLNAQEAFMIWMKAGLVTGAAITSPWIFYQLWLFIAAGLYRHEKGYVFIYLPMSMALFLAGASLAFFFVFDPVLQFLFEFQQGMNAEFEPRIGEWMNFVLIMPLGFGISFQLPLVMLFLNRIGIIETETWTANWRIAILSIFVIAMVLTPADPISMLLMAVPLCFLYVLGIGMCRWMPRGRSPFAGAYEPT